MTPDAQCTEVFEVTFPTTLDDGHDMVGIPEASTKSAFQSPVFEKFISPDASGVPELSGSRNGVGPAGCADTVIAIEDLFSKVCGLGTKLPFMHAKLGTKRVAAAWDLE